MNIPVDRSFLFLQGPTGPFFQCLGGKLRELGYKVVRVNFNGGDFFNWRGPGCFNFRSTRQHWPAWIARLMAQEQITDLFLTGDWRPLHLDAIDLARALGIKVHVFEEGYMRPNYITMEDGGVNGRSVLPKTKAAIKAVASKIKSPPQPVVLKSHTRYITIHTIYYYLFYFLRLPAFPFYKTHRPQNPLIEMLRGWLPRLLTKKRRVKKNQRVLNAVFQSKRPFFLFPLQLDSDAQVRRYSPFSGMLSGISHVMSSFAKGASKETLLLIKNHPLDYGLINYRKYVANYARALNIADRVYFIEEGHVEEIIKASKGLVLLNSTIGLSALQLDKPVFYLGRSICSLKGLGSTPDQLSLDDFWLKPLGPDKKLLADFIKVLNFQALINGNFYNEQGIKLAVEGTLKRLKLDNG